MINQELYIPTFAKIMSIRDESDLVRSYKLGVSEAFKPGQFLQVSILGVGEVPISISSSPTDKGIIELTIRNTGRVTSTIHDLQEDYLLGLRGPYGNSFPVEDMVKRDLIFVAGGIGLAPLRSLIRYVLDNRQKYGHIYLLYGAKTQSDMIYKDELRKWKKAKGFDLLLTLDKAEKGWKGNVGVVTTLFDTLKVNLKNYAAFVCGPSIMIKFTIYKLSELGLSDKDIFVTLERYMKCGVGKCGHCYLGGKYVCTDGPVFTFQELKRIKPETL